MHTSRLIGIDFLWLCGTMVRRKTKLQRLDWVASTADDGGLIVESLRTVQELPGSDHQFEWLIRFLGSENFAAAGIDAPFSVPSACVPQTHSSLLGIVAALDRDGRPFARGQTMYYIPDGLQA